MEITLPRKLNSQEQIIIDTKSIVVIGANGSGKTRFGSDIELRYDQQAHRISAQKSLTMPKEVSPKSRDRAESEFLYGYYDENNPNNNLRYKTGQRWGSNRNTFLLNDYEKLMVLLHTEEYEKSIKFKEEYNPGQNNEKPVTKLDEVKRIWEYVFPHRGLIIKAGSIDTFSTNAPDKKYNSSEMSDGERVVFYLIGEIVSAPENSILIIDEPEMHIHKSITKKLWDKIEEVRKDCSFIYLTHDIDFAASRLNSDIIWSKGFDGLDWDYEVLEQTNSLPQQLYLEILGSRKPILFIEGDDSSIDYKLLQLIYREHTTKPLGSCTKVIETTKSFSEQEGFHHIQSFGLIDRDRRTDEEVSHITNPNIWVAEVAEIENFLLLGEVVQTIASTMMIEDTDSVFKEAQNNIFGFFEEQLEKQALEHTISRVERVFNTATNSSSSGDFPEFINSMNEFWNQQDFEKIYTDIKQHLKELLDSKDYDGILKVFNNKGLLARSRVTELCNLNTRGNAYLNHVLGILRRESAESDQIRDAISNKIKT